MSEATALARYYLANLKPAEPLRRTDSRFLDAPPDDVTALFKVDDKGFIVDGPRGAPSEAIDYTALLNNETILQQFNSMVFETGRRSSSQTGHFVIKSSDEVRVSVVAPSNGQRFISGLKVGLYTNLIAEKTGVPIETLQSDEDVASILLIEVINEEGAVDLVSQIQMQIDDDKISAGHRGFLSELVEIIEEKRNLKRLNCSTTSWLENNQIALSVIIRNNEVVSGSRDYCILENFLLALSNFRMNDDYISTILTSSYKLYQFPTELDWLMLRMLYDQRIAHGMTKEEAQPILREILAETRSYAWED